MNTKPPKKYKIQLVVNGSKISEQIIPRTIAWENQFFIALHELCKIEITYIDQIIKNVEKK